MLITVSEALANLDKSLNVKVSLYGLIWSITSQAFQRSSARVRSFPIQSVLSGSDYHASCWSPSLDVPRPISPQVFTDKSPSAPNPIPRSSLKWMQPQLSNRPWSIAATLQVRIKNILVLNSLFTVVSIIDYRKSMTDSLSLSHHMTKWLLEISSLLSWSSNNFHKLHYPDLLGHGYLITRM